jgi:TetR/AcrR family transcriptional regulator, transcriptional repressor for nem operon
VASVVKISAFLLCRSRTKAELSTLFENLKCLGRGDALRLLDLILSLYRPPQKTRAGENHRRVTLDSDFRLMSSTFSVGNQNSAGRSIRTYVLFGMGRHSLRDQILRAGLPVLFRSGYHAASVRDICAAADAPQGSFTNHFRSKEAFAAEVLDRYFEYLKGLVTAALNDETLTPRQRLQRYLDVITKKLERDRWMVGCLIGDFSLQASSHSKLLRKRLDAIFREWRTLFASCIAAAQSAGEVDSHFDATELAEFLLASWEGAILRMKVERSPAALERFKAIVFETVFQRPSTRAVAKRHRRTRKNSTAKTKQHRR